VRWAQFLLVVHPRILEDAQIDGIFGPVTEATVRNFQTNGGLVVDGIVGPATWAALGGDGPEPPTLQEGGRGPVVGGLQTALNEFLALNPALAVDNNFGPITATAVRGLQTRAGITADGVVGLQTWAISLHAAGQVFGDLAGVMTPWP
jgi:peptidoglycan hydrolase-like protein with peptidoglycan-binding domain